PNEPQLTLALSGVYGSAAIRLAAARRWEDAEDRLRKVRDLVGKEQPDLEVSGYLAWGLCAVAHYYARAGLCEKVQRILAELEGMAGNSPEATHLRAPLGASFYWVAWNYGLAGDLKGMDTWVEQLDDLSKRLKDASDLDFYVL